jgi:hypothetical protein
VDEMAARRAQEAVANQVFDLFWHHPGVNWSLSATNK